MVKVVDLRHSEGPAKLAHSLLPFLLSDDGQPLDVPKVLEVGLDVLSESARLPPVEIYHFEQNADFAGLFDQSLKPGDEFLVVVRGELATDVRLH
jgi:hypothetical protein